MEANPRYRANLIWSRFKEMNRFLSFTRKAGKLSGSKIAPVFVPAPRTEVQKEKDRKYNDRYVDMFL